MYAKPKASNKGGGGNGGGSAIFASTQSQRVDEAKHAEKADEANFAKKAGVAGDIDINAPGLQNFLRSDEEDTAEKKIIFKEGLSSEADVLFKKAILLLGNLVLADETLGITSDGIATLRSLLIGNTGYGITQKGIATLREIVSAAFRSGALGSGFKLGDYNGSGDSYLEVDRLLVRKAAEFVRLVIRELQSVGGEIVLSPAAMKISNVVYFEKSTVLPEYDGSPLRYDVYRCYFSQKKGDEEIENQFVEDDLVRCQTFNVKEGVNENVKNRYYWRKVYKVGKDFIDLLADDCDTGSDIPQAGDELVQMGNVYDTARQSVVVLSAYGADAPSLKMYEGVDSYSLDNKEVFVLSRQGNLLVGSLFRKQGEGCFLLRSKIYRTSAHDGANVIFAPDAKAGGAQWGGAANSRNIHVTKDKTYTLAFWARTKSAKVEIVGETIWHSSATDTSRPGGYTGPNGSAYLGGVTITPSDGWHLFQKTFTVAANAPYEWISVACLKANASTASQQVYIAHPILIEGTAEDFVCWSASPDDYDYIGGNLLDNTRTFNKTGNLTRMDASVVTNESYNNGCSVIYANAASKYIEMAQWSVSSIIKKDEDYMFSFMAKGFGSIDAYMFSGSNLSIFAEDSERDTTTSNADGGRRFSLTSEWKRYWVHWRSEGTGIPNAVLIRCLQGSKAWVTMPKLEVGATPTDWIEGKSGFIEDSGIAAKLLRTGLDIENGKITATADKFEVRNNSGVVTASVNEKGLLEVGAGSFGGFVKKKKTIITPENIDQYRIPAASLSVVLFDFTNAGSFVEFQGDFNNYFKASQVDLVLPFNNPKDSLNSLHGVSTDEALQYVGQTLIIKNRANVAFVVHGGGIINKRGTTTSLKVNEISSNERLITTCEVSTTFGNPTSNSPNRLTAVGWNGNIYG